MILRPERYELLPIKYLLHGSFMNSGIETGSVTWPRATGSAKPTARRAVVLARRVFFPQTVAIRGVQWPNDGASTTSIDGLRLKAAMFYADGNTGQWKGTNGTNTGLPSSVHPQLQMTNSILYGDASTSGSAKNLYRDGSNGSTRGARLLFEQTGSVHAGTWMWLVVMTELLYGGAPDSEAAVTVFPAYATASEILTPHQQGGSGNSRNLSWYQWIGDGTTRALDTTDIAGAAWSTFENATPSNWLNNSANGSSGSGNSISSANVDMSARDVLGEFVVQF